MKTTMQKLIDYIEKNETSRTPTQLTSVEIHRKAMELLETEKEEIKDGLYSDLNHNVSFKEPQPTWADVRKTIEMARSCLFSNATGIEWKKSDEEIIEQLQKEKNDNIR